MILDISSHFKQKKPPKNYTLKVWLFPEPSWWSQLHPQHFFLKLQIAQGLVSPHLTMCSYSPFSVSALWRLSLDNGYTYESTALGKYRVVTSLLVSLQVAARELCMDGKRNVSQFNDKLCSIRKHLGSRELAFVLLRNVPNVPFDEIFQELGPSLHDTIKYCSNGEISCENITKVSFGRFPNCFAYNMQQSNEFSDEGILQGVTMVLFSGNQLASLALTLPDNIWVKDAINYLSLDALHHTLPGFQNTYLPSSSDAMRLSINIPGVMADVEKKGIEISPGYYTLVSIRGKEVIRLPEPYGSCTSIDNELKQLKLSVAGSINHHGNIQNNSDKTDVHFSYSEQDCRSACLQRKIWRTCKCLDLKAKLPFPNMDGDLLCGTLGKTETEMILKKSLESHNYIIECLEVPEGLLTNDKCTIFHKIINDLACVKKVTEEFNKGKLSGNSDCDCAPACYSYEYILMTSQSPWPSPGFEAEAAYNELANLDTSRWLQEYDMALSLHSSNDDNLMPIDLEFNASDLRFVNILRGSPWLDDYTLRQKGYRNSTPRLCLKIPVWPL